MLKINSRILTKICAIIFKDRIYYINISCIYNIQAGYCITLDISKGAI